MVFFLIHIFDLKVCVNPYKYVPWVSGLLHSNFTIYQAMKYADIKRNPPFTENVPYHLLTFDASILCFNHYKFVTQGYTVVVNVRKYLRYNGRLLYKLKQIYTNTGYDCFLPKRLNMSTVQRQKAVSINKDR